MRDENLSTTNISPNARDENIQLEYGLSAVFGAQYIGTCACTLYSIVPTVQTDGLCFCLLFFTIVLLCIGASRFWFCSHNFAAVIFKSLSRLLCSLPYVLPTFLRKSITTSSTSSIRGLIGGGSSRIPWTVIQPYAISTPNTVEDRSHVRFVALVERAGVDVEAYPNDQFVHADIPLKLATQLFSITIARSIARSHGISAGSRCNIAQLSSFVEHHECINCLSYLTIFSVESDSKRKNVVRSTTYRERKTQSALAACEDLKSTEFLVEFPPSPCSVQLEHAIIKDACKRMDPINFEEVGCAVCGELRQRVKTSRLKGIKNFLSILEVPGVTRVERATNAKPVKEFKGPVLDYSCSTICDDCRAHVRQGKVPRLALARGLWLGKVPPVLCNLTFVEKLLVARVRHTCAFVKVASGMRKMKANIVAFESPVPKIYKILPPPREDLDEMLAILFTGPCKPTAEDFARTPFLVRRNAVINALEWLKLNHLDYADIDISHANAMQYEDGTPPVTVEYRFSESNKVPEGTSVFDNEDADGTVEGDCVFTVHGLT